MMSHWKSKFKSSILHCAFFAVQFSTVWLLTRSQPSLSPHAVYGSLSCLSDQMRDNGRGEKQQVFEFLRKAYTGLASSQAGGCARVAGWYEMRGISHVWGTWEAPLSGRRSSGSQLFNTIYYTLLAKVRVTLVLLEHVRGERSKKIDQKQCTLLKWDKVSLSTHVRVWGDECLSHHIGIITVLYGVDFGLRGLIYRESETAAGSHMYLGCVWRCGTLCLSGSGQCVNCPSCLAACGYSERRDTEMC